MRKLFKKWGEAMLAALCVLAIVFAALYTRQDDLRRMAARSAGSSRDQTLDDAQAASAWRAPVSQSPEAAFAGAYREESGLWRFSPWVRFSAAFGQRVCAMHAGVVTLAADGCVRIDHGDVETRCRGLKTLSVAAGDTVSAGQTVGTADGTIELCALRGGEYIDPLSLIDTETDEPRL